MYQFLHLKLLHVSVMSAHLLLVISIRDGKIRHTANRKVASVRELYMQIYAGI
jgi:hypothetical protein